MGCMARGNGGVCGGGSGALISGRVRCGVSFGLTRATGPGGSGEGGAASVEPANMALGGLGLGAWAAAARFPAVDSLLRLRVDPQKSSALRRLVMAKRGLQPRQGRRLRLSNVGDRSLVRPLLLRLTARELRRTRSRSWRLSGVGGARHRAIPARTGRQRTAVWVRRLQTWRPTRNQSALRKPAALGALTLSVHVFGLLLLRRQCTFNTGRRGGRLCWRRRVPGRVRCGDDHRDENHGASRKPQEPGLLARRLCLKKRRCVSLSLTSKRERDCLYVSCVGLRPPVVPLSVPLSCDIHSLSSRVNPSVNQASSPSMDYLWDIPPVFYLSPVCTCTYLYLTYPYVSI